MAYRTSWYEELKKVCVEDGEIFNDLICYPSIDKLKEEFNAGFGAIEGCSFTAWGKNWVYFPISYGGAEQIGHAPRNPCSIVMKHQGGG